MTCLKIHGLSHNKTYLIYFYDCYSIGTLIGTKLKKNVWGLHNIRSAKSTIYRRQRSTLRHYIIMSFPNFYKVPKALAIAEMEQMDTSNILNTHFSILSSK